jgi:hypothetical protein
LIITNRISNAARVIKGQGIDAHLKKETIKQYTILYQYILLLKEPTYIFLIQVFQHLSPVTWWEDFIVPVLQRENKENFKYLDIADLLNVFKLNWGKIFKYLDGSYHKTKYDREYKLVNKVHWIRTCVAHANDIDMSPFILVESLVCLLDYARLIRADKPLVQKLELDWLKHQKALPENPVYPQKDESLRNEILSMIENKVLLNAVNCDTLALDIKLSVDRTTLRLNSMRTLEEIMGFFNGAMRSERGRIVEEALHTNGLIAFEDIKDEINETYCKFYEKVASGAT